MFEAHFQTFDDVSERAESAGRVAALRAELARRGLDGFVVPRSDRQQNEYLPASEERLAWLTGFTGSAGAAIVLAEQAAIFVDGRYTVQADAQVDKAVFAIEHLVETPPAQWLETHLTAGAKVGYDPWLHTTRRRRPPAQGLRQCRRRAGGGRRQPDRRAVVRPAGAAVRPGQAARHQVRRRKRRRQIAPHPGGGRQGARRRAGGVGPAERRLGLQHPRQRHRAHAVGAGLRRRAARGQAGALRRSRPSSTTPCAPRLPTSPTYAATTTSNATSRR